MRWPAPVVLAMAMALSGCISVFGAPDVEPKDLLAEARKMAREWDDRATLRGVVGVEAGRDNAQRQESLEEGDLKAADGWAYALLEEPDAQPGDGQAPRWAYTFAGPAHPGERHTVVLDGTGDFVGRWTRPASGERHFALGAWAIDAGEALGLVWAELRLAEKLEDPEAVLYAYELAQDHPREGPVWMILIIQDADVGDSVMVVEVNADSGDVAWWDPIGMTIPKEKGWLEGRVDLLNMQDSHRFTLENDRHDDIHVNLLVEDPGKGELEVHVEGPGGETYVKRWPSTSGVLTGKGGLGVVFDWPHAGAWDVTVTLTDGLVQDYRIAWCAPGWNFEFGFNFAVWRFLDPGEQDACYMLPDEDQDRLASARPTQVD